MKGEYRFEPYGSRYAALWDSFVDSSRNGTFLFKRGYMEYHSDRFADASLIALRRDKVVALLPASLQPDGTFASHAGLTYGGWILPPAHLDGAALLELFSQWTDYCRARGDTTGIAYKPVPWIYHTKPSQEELYALWRCGFEKSAVQLSSAIDLHSDWKFNMSKRQQARKALAKDITIGRSSDFEGFWRMLCQCLEDRHEASPVHTFDEIKRLASGFPDNIKLYTLSDGDGLQAGVCIYDTGRVAHSQYAATTARAREEYYLTALYYRLITEEFSGRAFFDFGTSNEEGGRVLNSGLLNQKFSMGATGVAYEQYSLQL